MDLGAEQFFNGMDKRLADIPTIGQDAPNGLQVGRAAAQGEQCPLAVRHPSRRDGDRVWQALGIDGNVALDPRTFLPAS